MHRIILALFCFIFSGCVSFFETTQDLKAQKALKDLAEIQEAYHKKNKKYARNLVQISENGFVFKYDTGLVYVEIEDSSESDWRAVALPAESTTARVFAFDTKQGGFYEMAGDEVSKYVLGSLNDIRDVEQKKFIVDTLGWLMLGGVVFFSVRIYRKNPNPPSGKIIFLFLMSILPLLFAFSVLNYMQEDVPLTPLILSLIALCLLIDAVCFILLVKQLKELPNDPDLDPLKGLIACAIVVFIFQGAIMGHTLMTYSVDPNPRLKFIKPPSPSL